MTTFLSGNATTRSVAETVEKAVGHLAHKEMPRATVRPPAKRYTPRPAPASEKSATEGGVPHAE